MEYRYLTQIRTTLQIRYNFISKNAFLTKNGNLRWLILDPLLSGRTSEWPLLRFQRVQRVG
jgi:hypothetical protein